MGHPDRLGGERDPVVLEHNVRNGVLGTIDLGIRPFSYRLDSRPFGGPICNDPSVHLVDVLVPLESHVVKARKRLAVPTCHRAGTG